jgi:hypothetical protein
MRRNLDWNNEENLYRAGIEINPPKGQSNYFSFRRGSVPGTGRGDKISLRLDLRQKFGGDVEKGTVGRLFTRLIVLSDFDIRCDLDMNNPVQKVLVLFDVKLFFSQFTSFLIRETRLGEFFNN